MSYSHYDTFPVQQWVTGGQYQDTSLYVKYALDMFGFHLARLCCWLLAYPCDWFPHILQGYFTATTNVIWFPSDQWGNLKHFGESLPVLNHSKAQQDATFGHIFGTYFIPTKTLSLCSRQRPVGPINILGIWPFFWLTIVRLPLSKHL